MTNANERTHDRSSAPQILWYVVGYSIDRVVVVEECARHFRVRYDWHPEPLHIQKDDTHVFRHWSDAHAFVVWRAEEALRRAQQTLAEVRDMQQSHDDTLHQPTETGEVTLCLDHM